MDAVPTPVPTPLPGLGPPGAAHEVISVVTAAGVAVAFVGAGLLAVRGRPAGPLGPLLIAVGVLWALAKLAPWPGPPGLRTAAAGLWAAVLAHVVLAFPSGRLATRPRRAAAALAYLSVAVVALLGAARAWEWAGARIPATAVQAAATGGAVVSGLVVLGVQISRGRAASAAGRRSSGPVLGAAAVAAALFATLKPAVIGGVAVGWAEPVLRLALAAVPLAYAGLLVRREIDRAGVAELVVRLRGPVRPDGVERALARALHDPDLRVGYRTPGPDLPRGAGPDSPGRYVDTAGRPLRLPPEDGRVVTRVDHESTPLAVVVHDPALLDDPELLEAACAAAGLALAHERLTAELRARLHELEESRGRILRAAETERRRLERDLHDGVQQRLLSIPLTLGLAESALREGPAPALALVGEAKETALAVLGELRALSQGIHPPVLSERGLAGAIRELAALAPLPVRLALDVPDAVPEQAETVAYYVVAEGLANVVKHAGAGRAHVTVGPLGGGLLVEVGDDGRGGADPERGSGLRGLTGRVAEGGGTLLIDSAAGSGTRIRAVLPCA
ncbi:hypothetical protein JOL79_01900 [Microbispora sp. RL4-1S]|uniref:histidine kinase n=1 Tax=Microbispora oryzae TaxID=2806554 RepID=A0A941AHX0_9ACTN|nr:histidine kinase [Microbispora oryzae]MBP2702553.1 hypothetical protein [Microbispora oryzae]